jgi:hypothetical protein
MDDFDGDESMMNIIHELISSRIEFLNSHPEASVLMMNFADFF